MPIRQGDAIGVRPAEGPIVAAIAGDNQRTRASRVDPQVHGQHQAGTRAARRGLPAEVLPAAAGELRSGDDAPGALAMPASERARPGRS